MKRRYHAVPRPNWEPPLFVVVDALTGAVLSKHPDEPSAAQAAAGMNGAQKR